MSEKKQNNCPLCEGEAELKTDSLYSCKECSLLFKDPAEILSFIEEKSRYDLHNNDLKDEGYLKYLNRLCDVIKENIHNDFFNESLKILDFGCGPVKGYEKILEGLNVDSYDPYYFSDKSILSNKYDLVICSEAAEHFNHPKKEFELLFSLLKPNGYLVIRTEFHNTCLDLSNWWYLKDPTHVVFYSDKCFESISQYHNSKVLYCSNPYVIFEKIRMK